MEISNELNLFLSTYPSVWKPKSLLELSAHYVPGLPHLQLGSGAL